MVDAIPLTERFVEVALVEVELTVTRFLIVEVALFARIPPERVERPVTDIVPVAVNVPKSALYIVESPSKREVPVTESVAPGEVVPMPTLPPDKIRRASVNVPDRRVETRKSPAPVK